MASLFAEQFLEGEFWNPYILDDGESHALMLEKAKQTQLEKLQKIVKMWVVSRNDLQTQSNFEIKIKRLRNVLLISFSSSFNQALVKVW